MKILFDGRMISKQMHGIARYTLDLAREFIRRGNDVTLLVSAEGREHLVPAWQEQQETALKARFVISAVPFAHPLEPLLLHSHWREYLRHDVVHFTSYALPLVPPRHTVATVHDLTHLYFGGRLKRLYFQTIVRSSLARVSQIIAISEWTRSDLREKLGIANSEQVTLVRNGIDDMWFQLRPHLQNPERHPYIMAVANPKPHKNIRTLIEAAENLWEKDLRFLLVLVGGGDWQAEALLKNPLFAPFIKVLKAVPDETLMNYYSFAQAFVSTSFVEGYNLPAAEALASGCPVILSRASAHLEFQDSNVHFYGEPEDVAGLAQALRPVILSGRSPHLGREKPHGISTVSEMADQTWAVYERAAQD